MQHWNSYSVAPEMPQICSSSKQLCSVAKQPNPSNTVFRLKKRVKKYHETSSNSSFNCDDDDESSSSDDDSPPLKRACELTEAARRLAEVTLKRARTAVTHPFSLKPEQAEIFDRLVDIVRDKEHICNSSVLVGMTGSGKTAVVCHLAKVLDYVVLAVCSNDVKPGYQKMLDRFNLPVEYFLNIEKFDHATPGKQGLCAGGFLWRTRVLDKVSQNKKGEEVKKYSFHYRLTNEGLRAVAQKRILLVIDECQSIKNKRERARAVCALKKELERTALQTRVIFMSATPFDKQEQITSFFHTVGICGEGPVTYGRKVGANNVGQLQQIVHFCKRLDPHITEQILFSSSYSPNMPKTDAHRLIFRLFQNVYKPHQCVLLKRPSGLGMVVKRRYYRITSKEDCERMRLGLQGMEEALDAEKVDLAKFNDSLSMVELSKLADVAADVKKKLLQDPNCKCIVGIWFIHKNGKVLRKHLSEFNPLELHGKLKPEVRQQAIKMFNENSNKHRLILVSIPTGGVGIELDDTYGNRRRHVWGTLSYWYQMLVQFAGRVCRVETKSVPVFRYVLGSLVSEQDGMEELCGEREQNMLDRLAMRDDIQRQVSSKTYEKNVNLQTAHCQYADDDSWMGDDDEENNADDGKAMAILSCSSSTHV